MAEMQPKLKIDVNHNPTKKGIKVQFIIPTTFTGDEKTVMTQKLQSRLNAGLAQYNLTANIDTDVPYSNIIGFMIRIQDISLMIKNALKGVNNGSEKTTPEEKPAE